MSKQELQTILNESTAIERDVLDRMASGYRKGLTSIARISRDTSISYWLVESALTKMRSLGLIDYSTGQGWYLQSAISEYFELRAAENFA